MVEHWGNDYELDAKAKACLPERIQCKSCEKVKPKGMFSNRQLQNLSMKIKGLNIKARKGRGNYYDPKGHKEIPCKTCTPKTQVEKQCHTCEVWKGRNEYNKTQFKDDDGVCELCGKERREKEATDHDARYSSGDSSGDGSDGDDNPNGRGTTTAAGTTTGVGSMSLNDGGTFSDSGGSRMSGGDVGGVNLPPSSSRRNDGGGSGGGGGVSSAVSDTGFSTTSTRTPGRYGSPTVTSSKASVGWAKPKTVRRQDQCHVLAEQERMAKLGLTTIVSQDAFAEDELDGVTVEGSDED